MQAPAAERRVERIVTPAQVLPRLFTRGHNVVVKPGGHADPINALDYITGSPWRVGQQHDTLARLDQAAKTFKGARQRGDTVVDDPPKIENDSVVARRQRSNPANQLNCHDAP